MVLDRLFRNKANKPAAPHTQAGSEDTVNLETGTHTHSGQAEVASPSTQSPTTQAPTPPSPPPAFPAQPDPATVPAPIVNAPARPTRPRVLMMDMDSSSVERVSELFHVSRGSLGTPYKYSGRSSGDDYVRIIQNDDIPERFTENDVVVIDLAPREILNNEPEGEPWRTTNGEVIKANWKKFGILNPRPITAHILQPAMEKILRRRGGVFVLFAAARMDQENFATNDIDNWSFLQFFSPDYFFRVYPEDGDNIKLERRSPLQHLSNLLSRFKEHMTFECILEPTGIMDLGWTPFAWDSYGKVVGGVLRPDPYRDRDSAGNKPWLIVVLPRIAETARPDFLAALLTEVLPLYSPHLYPHLNLWLHDEEYELPEVWVKQQRIAKIEEQAQQQIETLRAEIELERAEYGFLYDLLTRQGDELVAAVYKTFQLLDFGDVELMDPVMTSRGIQPREDLQVREDPNPLLLVESKGVTGVPTDEDALKVSKHIALWKEELGRDDVQGLTIFNHEMGKPPQQRENTTPFRKDLVTLAQQRKVGLLTTWDLYRVAVGYRLGRYTHEQVQELFWSTGRIDPATLDVPKPAGNYKYVGTITQYYKGAQAVGIRIEEGELHLGDRIAFELPDNAGFEEQSIDSMRQDETSISVATSGISVGVSTQLTNAQLKSGHRVFVVEPVPICNL
jgi:hypothetical protein